MRILDLTLRLEAGMSTFPNYPEMVILPLVTMAFSAPRYAPPCKGYASFQLLFNDHMGTHIDAPVHMCENKETIDRLPLSHFIGEAVFLDLSDIPPDKEITEKEIKIKMNDCSLSICENDIVIVRRWKGCWGSEGFFDCKAFDESAAAFLVERKIKLFGTDVPSVDVEPAPYRRRAHLKFLSNSLPIIENLVNLDKIDKNRFKFVALPLHIKGISASPTRAVAILE